jgi:hypothetical protein
LFTKGINFTDTLLAVNHRARLFTVFKDWFRPANLFPKKNNPTVGNTPKSTPRQTISGAFKHFEARLIYVNMLILKGFRRVWVSADSLQAAFITPGSVVQIHLSPPIKSSPYGYPKGFFYA